jgi:hypothetical protein
MRLTTANCLSEDIGIAAVTVPPRGNLGESDRLLDVVTHV